MTDMRLSLSKKNDTVLVAMHNKKILLVTVTIIKSKIALVTYQQGTAAVLQLLAVLTSVLLS